MRMGDCSEEKEIDVVESDRRRLLSLGRGELILDSLAEGSGCVKV